MYWYQLSEEQIKSKVFSALRQNINFGNDPILGIPATYLDKKVFYDNEPFLERAPFLSTLVANPNHIGCHTLTESEKFFGGTQQLEKEVISICAEQIFGASPNGYDGYIASGGTEANIEGLWIFRNYFRHTFGATYEEMAMVFSEDSHYSMPKGSDLLHVDAIVLPVDRQTRMIDEKRAGELIDEAKQKGKKYFLVVANCSTTMFGTTDDTTVLGNLFESRKLEYMMHVDGAFGGFFYPFTAPENQYSFKNPRIQSITIDAHKLLQAPYGTGIFLARKGLINHVRTEAAQYVQGMDHTLIGSRSGANAIAIWMVLHAYGSEGWKNKMVELKERTDRTCKALDDIGIRYVRNPYMNIIAIFAGQFPDAIAMNYHLVSNSWEGKTEFWKIVVMDHVKESELESFVQEASKALGHA